MERGRGGRGGGKKKGWGRSKSKERGTCDEENGLKRDWFGVIIQMTKKAY
jgi:hypothetical protein